MNILIPLAGNLELDNGEIVPLVQIHTRTVIEYVLSNLKHGEDDKIIFILREEDCQRHYLDKVVSIIDPEATIIKTNKPTQGQLCSALLAIGEIDNDEELLVVNGDQYIFENIPSILEQFKISGAQGGIISFKSVHPKWSYIRTDPNTGTVIETSEKIPISNDACAGFYYFKRGNDFVEAAKRVIKHGTTVQGNYFVSSTYNEMILDQKKIVPHRIPGENFFALDSEDSISKFIERVRDYIPEEEK